MSKQNNCPLHVVRKVLTLLAVLMAVISSGDLFAQHFKLTDTIPADNWVKVGHLSNGLTYYVSDNGSAVQNFQLRLVVNAGSILEDPDQLGLAHVMEHMNFNDLKHFPKNELMRYLQENGLQIGADLNAATGFESTNYLLWLATDEKKKIDKAFTILEDWDHNALLGEPEIDRERRVVLEESRIDKNAMARMRRLYLPALLNGSRYASRLPIGKDSIISNFHPESLKRFYKTWYRPDLSAVIAVGHIDPVYMEAEIEKHFKDYKNPENEIPRPRDFTVLPRASDTAMVVSDREFPNTVLELYFNIKKALPVVTWSDYRAKIMTEMVQQMISERIHDINTNENTPFLGGRSSYEEVVTGYEALQINVVIGDKPVKAAIDALCGTTESIRQFGFLADELQRQKNIVSREARQQYENRNKIGCARFAEQYAEDFINGSVPVSIQDRYKFINEILPEITLEDINKTASSLISGHGRFLLLLGGEQSKSNLPSSADLLAMLSEARKAPAVAHSEIPVVNTLMANDPVPGTLLGENTDKRLGTVFLTFKNGISVTLKTTTFKSSDIQMDAWRYGGSHNYPLSDKPSADNAARIVEFMGIDKLPKPALERYFAGKSVVVQPYMNPYEEGIEGKCNTRDLKEFLQLVHLYFTSPGRDEALFRSYIDGQKGLFRNLVANPQAFAADTLEKLEYANNPWSNTLPVPADFDRISLERVMEIYKAVFGNAKDMHFTFVGNFDPEVIKPLLELYLGSLPSADRQNKFTDEGLRPVNTIIDASINKGVDRKAEVQVIFNGTGSCTPVERLKLDLLTEVLNIKIFEKLRTEMGGVYHASAESKLQKRPYEHYQVSIRFPCAPENAEKLSAALFSIIVGLRADGVPNKLMDQVKQMMMMHHAGLLNTNEYWLQSLSGSWIDEEEPKFMMSYFNDIQAITLHDIEEAALKYLDVTNYIRLIIKS